MSKVYCRYCGKQIDEDATFCTHCGKEQNVSKKPSINVDGLRSSGKTIVQKVLALTHIPIDYVKTIKIPRMSAEKANLWHKRMKRVGKVVLALAVVTVIVAASAWGYSYYYDEYLPEKRLDEACADVLSKMRSSDKAVSIKYCQKILENETQWGFDDIYDNSITKRMYQHRDEAFRILETEAYNGNALAQITLGSDYYFGGDYVGNDTIKAVYWWNEAVKQDYIPAYNKMGYAYEHGLGVHQDLRKAIYYYKIGAEKGEAKAQANYGRLFKDGIREIKIKGRNTMRYVKETDYQSFMDNYQHSIKTSYVFRDVTHLKIKTNGTIESISDTDIDYEYDKMIISKDIEQAKYWWQKAAAQGNQYAKNKLQQVYE